MHARTSRRWIETEKQEEEYKFVFTLGTGALTPSQFHETLKDHNVSILVDVRSKPRGWNRGLWKSALIKRYGEGYHWLGDKVGGFDIDENYGSTRWVQGIHQIMELSKLDRVAIFCAEDDPKGCHRLIIAQDLEGRGIEVLHIRGSNYRVT